MPSILTGDEKQKGPIKYSYVAEWSPDLIDSTSFYPVN